MRWPAAFVLGVLLLASRALGAEDPASTPPSGFSERFGTGSYLSDKSWEVIVGQSALDDSPEVTASLPMQRSTDIALILRCREHKTDAILFKGYSYFGVGPALKVLVRIGDGKPLEAKWAIASTGKGVLAPHPIPFIQSLPNNTRMVIRALKADGSWIEGVFDLGDVTTVRDKISTACKWPR
jgi:hypothetical protein